MKGWQILVHSVRLVLRNLDAALRVSLVLYLVQVANQLYLFTMPVSETPEGMPMMDVRAAFPTLLLGIAAIVASLWIAVAWHRYVLNEEYPQGWLPRWHGSNMLNYLGRSIMIGLLIALAMLVAAIPGGLLTLSAPGLGGVLVFGLIGLAAYLFFRLAVMLPAAAMGRPMTLGDAWTATKDKDGAVVLLALIVIAASVIIQLPSLAGGQGTVVDLLYQIVTGWFATIIGISVLTTLYGHYVEGRPID